MEKFLYDQKPFSNIPLFRYLGPEYFTELKNRESRGHGNMAVSKSNAMGPFQIKEVALQELKNRYKELGHINKDALFDPGTSLKLASLYLDHIGDGMKPVLGKDKNPDPGLILAGYRLGPSYVTKILKTLPEDQRTWMGFRRHLSESGDMDDSQKTSVLKYLDTILMSAADPQSRDNKAYNTELKRAQSHPFFFYQTGNRVPDLGGGRSEHADGPDNSEDKNNLGDLLGRFKSLTGGIGSVMGTAGIANGDPTMGVVGSVLSGFANAGLPGAVVQGGMGLISAYQNKANEELAMLESEEALRRSKSVGMDKGFDGYNQTLYQKGGPIKRRLHVIGNSNAKIYDDKKLMDLYRNVMSNDPQFKHIDNTLDVLWNQEPNSILPRVYTTPIRKNSSRLRNLIRESVLPPNYYDNIDLLGNKKDALTADKYAEIYGEPKSTFETEYNRLSPELKKHYRDISYTAIDKQPQELEKILSGLSKDDQIMIMDHVGGKMLGIPMKQLSEIFKTHYPKDNKNPCLWGACDGATILPEFSKDSGINAIGTYLDQWKGGDPKKDNLINILFPDKTNRRLYKSDGSTEKLQLGSALRKAFSNRFLKSIILDEGEYLPINPSKYSFSEDIWPKKLNETVQLLDWQKNPNYNSSLIYGKGSIELAPYSLPYMHSPYVKEKFLSDAMASPSKNRKGGIIEGVNQTGYTPGTDSFENDVNVIPSNIITMKNTPFDVLGIPNKGRAKLMKAGLRKIVFPGADYVTEIPIKQSGGSLRNSYIKEGFQAHTADGHYIEPNNFRIRPSTLELDNITKIPGRFSTPDTYPNDINYNRHTNMSDEQHKYLQDAYAKLKGMYVETARTPAFDPNEQFILDQDNARQLDYTLLKNRFGIKQTGGNISAINLNTDLGPIPNFRRRITTSNPLPVASQYAQDGSVYPPNAKVKVNHNNQIKEYDINSSEYRDLYNSGKLMSYDKTTDTYSATPLKEVTVTADAPQWLKYKRKYEETNPKSNYINSFLTPFAKSLGNTETNYPKRLDDEYEQKSLDYVSEQLIKNKPQGKLSRAEWLNQMSDKEEELIKRNPKYQSSLWADTKRGLTSLVEQNPLQTFQNILNSSDYTNREKKEMLKDYIDHPVMSKLGDATKILNPLTVPSKMVQSTYKDDYSFTDALKGKKNNAGIVEDIVTDPLNLVGAGLVGKLSKADKVIDATKAGSKVLNKLDNVVKPAISIADDVTKQTYKTTWQLEELPGLHLKSTMTDGAISKIVEPKTGLVNVEQALGIIGKESGGADKVALIKQGLGENIPKKMDYNEFRKVVQDQLIPLEKQFATHSSDYGIDRLGYGKYKTVINERGNPILQPLKGKNLEPLENQTLILGNKNKFGRGSSAHGNPEETLGHIHFLRDAETPDVLTVTQIQSDAFQGTHRIMPKNTSNATALERQKKSLQRMEELQNRNKSVLNKMKTEGVDEAGLPVQEYQIKQFEDIVKAQEQSNLFKKADIENFTQKQLLDKNHQERYLQELVDYAGKRGDINKVRVPTSETAAKVQGYVKQELKLDDVSDHDIILYNELRRKKDTAKLYLELNKSKNNLSQKEIDNLLLDINNPELKRIESAKKYSPEHQTILKKYSEQPKTIKKLFDVEPKIVTDKKGNTWYEFDIPNKFKEGKGEIKAFQVIPPAIGSALYLQSQNKNKSEQ